MKPQIPVEWDCTGDVCSDLLKMANRIKTVVGISPDKPLQITVRNEEEANRARTMLGDGNYEIWISGKKYNV
jgi:hypothetical protein